MSTPAPHLLPVAALPGVLVPGVAVEWKRGRYIYGGRIVGSGTHILMHAGDHPLPVAVGDSAFDEHVALDLRDPLTRCAVARALAVAWGMEPGHTAPAWEWDGQCGVWVLALDEHRPARWAGLPGPVNSTGIIVAGIPDGPSEEAAVVALAMTVRAFVALAVGAADDELAGERA